ncbi:hypothetical protein [Thalassotalea sp. G2M2-11]|uniref:hypothetical protein n=1 Tax=Thalassotalea sp. G2M2-11 TaxID=2787627 RepID=UPI0019D2916B|nr:hypothetical protein [Thalassotalea sp. G2M2-11]
MSRQSLKLILLAVIVVGISFSFVPLIASLKPSENSLNKAPHIDLSLVQKGQTVEFSVPQFKVIISKHDNEQITAFAIPSKDGIYLLPEFDWQRPMLPCKSFIQNENYQCVDTIDKEPVWFNFMEWDKSGKYIGENKWGKEIPDLITPKYKIAAGQFIYLGV